MKQGKHIAITFLLILLAGVGFGQGVEEYQRYHQEGRELAKEEKFKEAIAAFSKAIDIMPYYSAIHLDRGATRLQVGDFEGAIEDLDYVAERQPYKKEVFFLRGIAHYHLGDYGLASEDVDHYLTEYPNNQEAKSYKKKLDTIKAEEQAVLAQQLQQQQSKKAQMTAQRRARNTQIVLGTVVPLAVWTALVLSW
ncbi:tetratricopeptide repeat protein [Persicobacter diffluens]|uniref:Tetratricopeptide repeat protein n=1 Tax=Persicobacter diffluens TaxID=981 RepID=A0AAN4VZ76_9BACT|nr:hypothetical protein PEDI_24760 [Persicobacter diffluens]